MEIAIVVLGLVIAGLLVDRYFYTKRTQGILEDSIKAVMSRNMNEYLAAKTIDKALDNTVVPPEDVEISQASDTEFDKFIKQQNK